MPEFHLDTSGTVPALATVATPNPTDYPRGLSFGDLDAFTQGYIEAMFFTEEAPGVTTEEFRDPAYQARMVEGQTDGSIPGDVGFADLDPETLARIIADCQGFKDADHETPWFDWAEDEGRITEAGRDFWYTRNGHGCGFWDGDWPEPYATALTDACNAFGSVDVYLGDDGKVYAS